jgi:DNA-binding CsgD family transcriptional regulator
MTPAGRDLSGMIAHVGEAISAAELAPEHWQEVAARLCGCAPGTKILLQTIDKATFLQSSMVSLGFSDSSLGLIASGTAPPYPWQDAWAQMKPFQAAWADNYLPRPLLKKTDYYAEVLRPEGEADSATGMLIADDPDRVAAISIHYDGRTGVRTHALLQSVLEGVAGRLRRTIDINRAIAQVGPIPLGETSLLRSLGVPAFVVDDRGRLLATNAAADALFADRQLLRVKADNRLQFVDPATDRAFAVRVQRACLGPITAIDPCALDDLPVDHPALRVVLTVLPVTRDSHAIALKGVLPLFVPGTVAMVLLRPRVHLATDLAAQLRRRFGLTGSEVRLALALQEGGTLSAVAGRLGVTRETVRSHLRSAFAKTGTHRQRELVALVLRLAGR